MIKSIHRLFAVASEAEYAALETFFTSLGLAAGESWEGRRSKGLKLDAPESGVELFRGEGAPEAELVLEVDNASIVADAARRLGYKFLSEPAEADWGAQIFTLEMPGGGRLAIFSYNENWRNKELAGGLDATGKRFAIVVARFNAFITERLLDGALDALRRSGAKNEDLEIVRVPGAYEIPLAARQLAETGRFDGVVALGCLLRGETAHYDVIVNEVSRGIGEAMQATKVPIGFGVLTCDTLVQAIDRAGLKSGNKGFEAAQATMEMANLGKKIGGQ
jgi:6,7-dimethyl-8-ribityllumazine synthase